MKSLETWIWERSGISSSEIIQSIKSYVFQEKEKITGSV